MENSKSEANFSFVVAVIDDIYKWMEKISNSISALNTSLDKLAENLLDRIVNISEDFQTITNLIKSSRDTQFKTVFNMFSKNMEAIEEIRDITLNLPEQQKGITNDFYKTLEKLQKKMYHTDYQSLISDLKDLANELKNIKV